MTETTTIESPQQAAPGPEHPSNTLMDLIAALLAPMFLAVTGGDIDLARMAAIETVTAYSARNHADLIAIAQIIAYGLAALASLSVSLADDISISMALRLRGNANALNRSAEQNRRAIANAPPAKAPHPEPPGTTDPDLDAAQCHAEMRAYLTDIKRIAADARTAPLDAAPIARMETAAAPTTAFTTPTPTNRETDAMWAAAMSEVAAEFSASLAALPPAERESVTRRVAALNITAEDLRSGPPRPPFRTHPG